MTEMTFTFHINDGGGEKTFDIVQNIAAPSFVVKPKITYTNASQQSVLQLVREGVTDIHVQIANEGHFNSGPYLVNFAMQAPFMSSDSPSRTFDALAKGGVNDLVFRVHAHSSQFDEAWLNTIIQVSDGIRQTTLDTLLPYGGFNESSDPEYFNSHNWQMSGDADWAVTNEEAYSGDYSVRSGYITHNQSSSMSITQETQATEIIFYRKISSEASYDKLHFYIDDEDMGEWSGVKRWGEERYSVPQGTHTFKWSYIKDHSVHFGEDCAWVDEINILPGHTAIAYSGGPISSEIE